MARCKKLGVRKLMGVVRGFGLELVVRAKRRRPTLGDLRPSDVAKTALDVFASAARPGVLARSDLEADSFLFTYAANCRPEDAVSLTMPVIRDPYDSMGTVHPIFEMNLPEGALLEKLRMRFAKAVTDFDNLALLTIVGRSQIGRLQYALAGESLEEAPAQNLAEILAYRGGA